MNVYGRMYVGTKDKSTSYVKYDPTENDGKGLLTVKAKLIVESDDGDVTLIEGGMIRTNLIKTDELFANVGNFVKELHVGLISDSNYHFNVSTTGKLEIKDNSNIV
nr:MAG TPA: hypothetical protein [Caudoviricetes sp.]